MRGENESMSTPRHGHSLSECLRNTRAAYLLRFKARAAFLAEEKSSESFKSIKMIQRCTTALRRLRKLDLNH
jgi:hypothetical protein